MTQKLVAKPDLSHLPEASRRKFLQGGAGLVLAFAASQRKAWAGGEEPSLRGIGHTSNRDDSAGFDGFTPGGFIRIAPTGKITLIVPNVEMGQGVYTSEAMLIAEELEVGLDQVDVLTAPPNEALYKQPLLKSQTTGGSTSVRGAWTPLRQAGASARMMLIAAAARDWNVPETECRARRAEVRHEPSGRSLPYSALADAASRQQVPADPPLKPAEKFQLIGHSAPRVEGASKTNGSALFGIDVRVPGMKIATVAACPVFGGRLVDVDDSAARKIRGVRDILKIGDAVAVTADHFWAAKQGLAALQIKWDERNSAVSSQALKDQLALASQSGARISARRDGDIDAAFGRAAKKIDATYELPFLAHAALEPINLIVHVRRDGCEIWGGTQVPTAAQALAAKAIGLPVEKVVLHNQLIGGAFGRRLEAEYFPQAAAFAKQVDYPVKFIWTREEDIQHDLYRPAYLDRVAAGLDENGRPIVWTDHITGGSILGHYMPGGLKPGELDTDAVEGAKQPPYDLAAVEVDWVRADPPVPISWWRGVGPTHNVFVVESFVDELAHAANADPLDYRLALLDKNPRAANVLRAAAEKAGWGQSLPKGVGRGVSLHDSFGSFVAAVVEADVSDNKTIKLRRLTCAIDCGMTVNPDMVRAQLEGGLIFGLSAAMHNEITFKDGRVEQSNFNDYLMLRMKDFPPVEVVHVESSEAPGGVGETGTVSAAPALGNAIFAATGRRLRRYPFDTALRASQT